MEILDSLQFIKKSLNFDKVFKRDRRTCNLLLYFMVLTSLVNLIVIFLKFKLNQIRLWPGNKIVDKD